MRTSRSGPESALMNVRTETKAWRFFGGSRKRLWIWFGPDSALACPCIAIARGRAQGKTMIRRSEYVRAKVLR